ncbi:hypothetical protein UK12_33545, partial [Saccharothrix sp. ST-888]
QVELALPRLSSATARQASLHDRRRHSARHQCSQSQRAAAARQRVLQTVVVNQRGQAGDNADPGLRGAGAGEVGREFRFDGGRGGAVPGAVAGTVLWGVCLGARFPDCLPWLAATVLALGGLALG